ncbi:DUF6318 family protein [Arthrobacter sp.]|uniref:DUF6318 family protein n=1 Tax=Arthrobacter sp. TaxID=1667 RepID=UPI003A91CF82
MPVTITRKTRNGLAIAAIVALALSACSPSTGSDDPSSTGSGTPSADSSSPVAQGSATPSPTQSATPTPVPASSKGPAKNWPVPKMPEAAKAKTPKGLKAFSEHYFALMSYTVVTSDPDPMKKVTSKYCDVCVDGFIDAATLNQRDGTWSAGGHYDATITMAQMVGKKSGTANFNYKRAKVTLFNSDGSVYGVGKASTKPVRGTFSAVYENGWKITELNISKS